MTLSCGSAFFSSFFQARAVETNENLESSIDENRKREIERERGREWQREQQRKQHWE